MFHHPIPDQWLREKIKGQLEMLKKLVKIGEDKKILHKPIGGNRRIGKKHRRIILDYHALSESYNTQKEINLVSLELLIEILELALTPRPIARVQSN